MSQILRDRSGKTIAEIRQQGSLLVIFDAHGRTLGWYHEGRNITYDAGGSTVGTGNLLTMLIR